jgi:hypothetical protein
MNELVTSFVLAKETFGMNNDSKIKDFSLWKAKSNTKRFLFDLNKKCEDDQCSEKMDGQSRKGSLGLQH